MNNALAQQFTEVRRELNAYLCRLVIRPQVAEELAQSAYLRCLEASDRLPDSDVGLRAWIFRVATNLAFDEMRRHANWRETMLSDLRETATSNHAFVESSRAMAGSTESKAIAREHLVACVCCNLRNLSERRAAAVLLKEIHGFSVVEIADLLDVTVGQVKNWLQEARAYLTKKYGSSCALLSKTGVCHQCVELDGFMGANQGSPLVSDDSLDRRFSIAQELRSQPWGVWHRMMFQLIDELA